VSRAADARRVRCPSCRTPRITVDLLPHAEYRVRIVHQARCRTRWSDAARQHCDLHILQWLDQQGVVLVPDYGYTQPKHRFAGVIS
jgi:hypothetical protein